MGSEKMMSFFRLLALFYCITGLTTSCSTTTKRVPASALNSFVADPSNGFIQSKEVGDFTVQVKYMPPTLLALMESDGVPKRTVVDSLVNDKKEGLVFSMKLTHESISFHELLKDNPGRYERLTGPLNQDLSVAIDDQIFPCKIHHFEADYGVSKSGVVSVYFDRPDAEEVTFIYNDQLFNLGPLKFRVPINQLDNSFKLVYDEEA